MFRWVLVDRSVESIPPGSQITNSKLSQSGSGVEGRARKKRLLPIILVVGILLIAAGYVVFYTGGNDVIPPLGNVRADLNGTEYETPSEPLVPREEIGVRPTVTNTGDVSIYP